MGVIVINSPMSPPSRVQNSKMYRGVLEGELENGENIGRHSDSHINASPYNTYIVVMLLSNLLCLSVIYPTEMYLLYLI